ncbi:PP2C family protein-serine/threonine phosphatase [Actinomadura sp. SCN-SB]|uniref:PP2C family protein-serine/threonine phosphatase n=1 Tax=Actinomadura sp. SCN-SB TaxID=3373092 RepID=UPI00375081AB
MLVPLSALALIGALDLLLPDPTTLMALLAVVPATAVLRPAGTRLLAVVTLATLGVAAPLGVLHWAERPVAVTTSLLGTVVTTAMVWVAFRRLERGVDVQDGLRRVAEAAQRAVLRPVPRRVGPVDAVVRYLAADAQASVGGDLYGIVDSPYGIRMIMGDAMGKGLGAVEKAADVLGAFRGLAWNEVTLAGVAERLDAFLAAQEGEEGFVTAVLVEIPAGGGGARVVNCGHPPPLVLSGGAVTCAEPPGAGCAPPLGLHRVVGGPDPVDAVFEVPLVPGDRLLLYTDGVSEARDADGRFFPLIEHVCAAHDSDLEALPAALEAGLRAHVGGRLRDDAAMLLIRLNPDPVASSVTGRACPEASVSTGPPCPRDGRAF